MESLISRGHGYDDVLRRYTMEQVVAFSEAASANRAAELKEVATANRAAQATEKGWRAYMDHLDRASLPMKKEEVVMPRSQAKGLKALLSKRVH